MDDELYSCIGMCTTLCRDVGMCLDVRDAIVQSNFSVKLCLCFTQLIVVVVLVFLWGRSDWRGGLV